MSTIAENIQTLFDIKSSIKDSINAKGGTITDSTPYEDYATAIDNLPSGGGEIVIGDNEPLTFVLVEGIGDDGVGLFKNGSPNTTGFQYRIDDGAWQDYTVDTYIPMTKGHKLQFQNTTRTYVSNAITNYLYFKTKGIYRCGGNVMSLCNYATAITTSSCCTNLFYNTSIINAPCLPATTLATFCYQNMFRDCKSLVNAPQLPATELDSACYSYMFYGCTLLVNAPQLPATTLAQSCYECMFRACTSLVNAPELPATTLATTCYNYMFNGCSSLTHIKAMFTTAPSSTYTNTWLSSAKNTTDCVFEYNPEAEWVNSFTRGTTTVPSNWQMIPASV